MPYTYINACAQLRASFINSPLSQILSASLVMRLLSYPTIFFFFFFLIEYILQVDIEFFTLDIRSINAVRKKQYAGTLPLSTQPGQNDPR